MTNIKALNQEADGYETYQLVFASADQPQNPGTPGDQTPAKDSGTPAKDAGTALGSNGSQNTRSVPAQSNKLPNTSTNMFNLLLFGLLLVAAGGGMLFLKIRRV
ncbi:LPXTG cell wall anchor domain-containing protein [Bacillus sp. FJAT-29814]|uniref:LPXTG cell wall anchor domain-containing protein n=1 Tax=Bacillus sp. FJAT-29814 TaxID=1729688 RepID=UPI000835E5A3|nr:LPXTG cell wall anchor domain-containing protein [Bacillus sp. FJAT-29814]